MGIPPLNVLGGLDDAAAYKVPCACATTTDMTNTMIGLPVIDGYQTQQNDRILVRANTNQATNGIWVANALGAWSRAIDFSNQSAIYNGTQVLVVNGATYAGWVFSCQQNNPQIGGTPITFANNVVIDTQGAYYAALAEAAASTAQAISNLNLGVWATRAAFAAANIDTAVTGVEVLGYSAPGDGGRSIYEKLGSPPVIVLPGHLQTADGAWWAIANEPFYRAEQFGAFTTSSDCTAAVNNAILWMSATGGGELRFGGGSYAFAGTIAVQSSGIMLSGAGNKYDTTFVFGVGTANCIAFSGVHGGLIEGGGVRNININSTSRTGGNAISLYYVWYALVSDVSVTDGWNGIEVFNSNTPTINSFLIQTLRGSYGIYWHAPADSTAACPVLNLSNIVINAGWVADGLWWDGAATTLNASNVTVINCRVGLWIKNTAESANYCPEFGLFWDFVTDGCMLRSVQIDGGRQFHFTDCWLQNTSNPNLPNNQGFNDQEAVLINGDVGVSYTSDITFINGHIGNSKQNIVTLTNGPRDIIFEGVWFIQGGKGAVNVYDTIYIDQLSQDITIVGNKFHGWGGPLNMRYGVNIQPNTYRIVVDGNNFYGLQTAAVRCANTDRNTVIGPTQIFAYQGAIPTSGVSGSVSPAQSVGSLTLSPAQMLGGVLQALGSPSGAFTQTTPSAASLVAAVNNPFYLLGVPLLFINSTTQSCTLAAGAGVSFAGNLSGGPGAVVVSEGSQRMFMIVFNSTVPGAETVTIYG